MQYLIIEDETIAAQRLKKMVSSLLPESHCVIILDSIESSVNYFKNNTQPDIVFCDIQLADGDSFAIFEQIEINCPIIFTTAYSEYAIAALRLQAVDYLLKPIKKEELENAVENVQKRLRKSENNDSTKILTKVGSQVKVINYQDVMYYFSQEKITFAVLKDGKKYPVPPILEQLEIQLPPQLFFRANRQFIIRKEAIVSMQTYSKSRMRLILNPPTLEDIIISTERTKEFKKWLVTA